MKDKFSLSVIALLLAVPQVPLATGDGGPPPQDDPLLFPFPIPPLIEEILSTIPQPFERISDVTFICPIREGFDPDIPTPDPVSGEPIRITFNVGTPQELESREIQIDVQDLNSVFIRTFGNNSEPLSVIRVNLGENTNFQTTPGEIQPLGDEQADFVNVLRSRLVSEQLQSCITLNSWRSIVPIRPRSS